MSLGRARRINLNLPAKADRGRGFGRTWVVRYHRYSVVAQPTLDALRERLDPDELAAASETADGFDLDELPSDTLVIGALRGVQGAAPSSA
jgi:hypothetical protein